MNLSITYSWLEQRNEVIWSAQNSKSSILVQAHWREFDGIISNLSAKFIVWGFLCKNEQLCKTEVAPFIINFLNGSVWGRFCTFHANKRKSAIFWTWSAQKIFLTGLFFPFYFLPKRWIIFAGPFNKVPKDCNLGEGCGSHHFVAWRSPLLKKILIAIS